MSDSMNGVLNSKTYIIDVDDTICFTKNGDYENAVPYKVRIDKINKLYDEGNIIIYETARGQKTGKNWIDFTRKQLYGWGAKFKTVRENHYADYYINDKNLSIKQFFLGDMK